MFEVLEQNLIQVNIAAQTIPGLAPVMHALSFLGVETFYFLLVPLLFWFFRRRQAMELLFMIVTTAYVNCLFKWMFSRPRPYWISTQVQGFANETSYGIPSGHSQNALVVWMVLASILAARWPARKRSIFAACAAVVVSISFARIYLGVHFLQDVLAGWLIGGVLLLAYFTLRSRVQRFWETSPFRAATLVLPFVMIALGFAVRAASPGLYAERGPLSPHTMLGAAGTLLGALVVCLTAPVEIPLTTGRRVLLFAVTILIVFAVQAGLGPLLPREGVMGESLRVLRYFLVAVVGFLLIPWSAKKLLS